MKSNQNGKVQSGVTMQDSTKRPPLKNPLSVFLRLEKILRGGKWGENGPPPPFNEEGISYGIAIRGVQSDIRINIIYGPTIPDAMDLARQHCATRNYKVLELGDMRSSTLKEMDLILAGEDKGDGVYVKLAPTQAMVKRWRGKMAALENVVDFYRKAAVARDRHSARDLVALMTAEELDELVGELVRTGTVPWKREAHKRESENVGSSV